MHTKAELNYGQIFFWEQSTGERRAMKMASMNPRWLEFLAFARMVKHFNRLGQTLSLTSHGTK